ncbi:UNVERIFIED_CONTAM: phosphoribosylaminoimidazole-succinocarboxamide synthase [Acetivibrio alkalicellulosi]
MINNTDFIDLPLHIKGKVRNVYDLGDRLLIVVTDRISAFDVVFDRLIPDKGKVLNSISEFWFDYTKDIVDNHMMTTDVSKYPDEISKYKDELQGRSMVVKKIKMIEAEFIVRGYLEGSSLKEYIKTGKICGIDLPKGLRQGDKLLKPLFTPSSKSSEGHDENISFETLCTKIGEELANKIKNISLMLYERAREYAYSKGIILADTKFEFGIMDDRLILADEIFTPDSSRFWDAAEYQPGKAQKSFDKQYLREYLEDIGWDKNPPAPELPDDVVNKTRLKYIEAYQRITGKDL